MVTECKELMGEAQRISAESPKRETLRGRWGNAGIPGLRIRRVREAGDAAGTEAWEGFAGGELADASPEGRARLARLRQGR